MSDIAALLNFKPTAVAYILYKLRPTAKYQTFQIPKRSGGQRTIDAPVGGLKRLQRNLADLLQDCDDEICTAARRMDRISHGFRRRRSIMSNAREHRHRRWVFNLDLEDFFPSINFGRIRGFLIKNRDFALNPTVATIISQIACYADSLPQGSPCSPIIANLIAHLLDVRLSKLAAKAGCIYSRYADDLTFSTNKKEFPIDIAIPTPINGGSSHFWQLGEPLRQLIERSGFRVNDRKTHVMYRSSRQEVTGLVVNDKISVPSTYRHNVRAMVNRLVKTGTFEVWRTVETGGQPVLEKRPGAIDELQGMLGFIDSVDVYNRLGCPPAPPGRMSSKELTHRKFLMYSTLWAAKAPVVICEGETDNVYLTHAIRSLASEFPELAEVKPDKKIRLKIRLFKYPQSSTARLMALKGGGSSVLSSFIIAYHRETNGFAGAGMMHPVIILFDNDDGKKPILSVIKNIAKQRLEDDAPFVRVTKNMYAVPTPGNSSKIEDFFDASIKEMRIAGKSFNDGNGFDEDKHYGKKIFAHKIVAAKAATIDFSRFRPLLTNFASAIRDHAKRLNLEDS